MDATVGDKQARKDAKVQWKTNHSNAGAPLRGFNAPGRRIKMYTGKNYTAMLDIACELLTGMTIALADNTTPSQRVANVGHLGNKTGRKFKDWHQGPALETVPANCQRYLREAKVVSSSGTKPAVWRGRSVAANECVATTWALNAGEVGRLHAPDGGVNGAALQTSMLPFDVCNTGVFSPLDDMLADMDQRR